MTITTPLSLSLRQVSGATALARLLLAVSMAKMNHVRFPHLACCIALIGSAALAACSQSFQNVVSDPIPDVAQPMPLRAQVHLTSWKVDYQGPAGWGAYHTSDDPALLAKVQAEIERVLSASDTVRIAASPQEADIVVNVTLDVRGHASFGALFWTYTDYGLAFLPALLGAPLTWATFTTNAHFTVLNRNGQQVGEHQDSEERAHLVSLYYGYGNVDRPFARELKDILGSFGEFLRQQRATLAPPGQAAPIGFTAPADRPEGPASRRGSGGSGARC